MCLINLALLYATDLGSRYPLYIAGVEIGSKIFLFQHTHTHEAQGLLVCPCPISRESFKSQHGFAQSPVKDKLLPPLLLASKTLGTIPEKNFLVRCP